MQPDLRRRMAVLLQVAEAVAYAHGSGVLHRDLKPSNVRVDGADRSKLLDFGIGKSLDAGGGATRYQALTPDFAAPEQLLGEATGPWTDVYALGTLLYWMVLGRGPFEAFDGNWAALFEAAAGREPLPPSALGRALPNGAAAWRQQCRRTRCAGAAGDGARTGAAACECVGVCAGVVAGAALGPAPPQPSPASGGGSRRAPHFSFPRLRGKTGMGACHSATIPTCRLGSVTGASRGLGRHLALQLAQRGHRVLACARDEERLAQLAESGAGDIRPVTLDLSDARQIQVRLRAAMAGERDIAGVINNAGIGHYKPFTEHSEAELLQILQVNLGAVMQVCHAVLPRLLAQGRGHIVNIGSDLGRRPLANMAAYVASKHGLAGFTHSLLREVKDRGVRVTLVNPGLIDTDFNGGAGRRQRWLPLAASRCAGGVDPANTGAARWAVGRRSERAPAWAGGFLGLVPCRSPRDVEVGTISVLEMAKCRERAVGGKSACEPHAERLGGRRERARSKRLRRR